MVTRPYMEGFLAALEALFDERQEKVIFLFRVAEESADMLSPAEF